MWFKNLRIYRLTDALPCANEELGAQLAAEAFVPCGKSDRLRSGWVPPLGPQASDLVHSAGGFHLLCLRTQEKLLPASAVTELLDEKLLSIETEEARKVGRRERIRIKDEIIHGLLPRALLKSRLTWAFLAAARGMLLIDSSSPARAEELLNALRGSLGRLSVKPLVPVHSPVELMTRWLGGGRMPAHFRLGEQCDLRDSLHAANVARFRGQDLSAPELRAHLQGGKHVNSLGLDWRGRLQFVLHEDLSLRGLKFAEIVKRDPGVDEELDEAALFDANFALMSLELDRLTEELVAVFGVTQN